MFLFFFFAFCFFHIHYTIKFYLQIRYSRENVQAKFELDGKEYHSEYQLSCGGFTSIVFGSVGKADWGRKVITSLEVSPL